MLRHSQKFLTEAAIIISIISIALGAYFIFSEQAAGFDMLTSKVSMVYALLVVTVLFWFMAVIIHAFLDKANVIEHILLDLRDGTRTFYREKRKDVRIKSDNVTARLVGKDCCAVIKVLDIGYEGALLRSDMRFQPGEVIDLNMRLPFFPQPIDLKAKVVRVDERDTAGKPEFDIGIDYLEIQDVDRMKLYETVGIMQKTGKAPSGSI